MSTRPTAEFVVNIPMGEESLRGKFKVNIKLTLREILEQDAIRRSLLGPQGGDVDGFAAVIAGSIAKIRTHVVEAPSWWSQGKEGLDFDDINVVLTIVKEINKVENDHLEDLKKAANKASDTLKKGLETA